jgi:hypothetical protein
MLWSCGAGALVIVGGTLLFWYAVRVPWATMITAWVLICLVTGSLGWLFSRSLREERTGEPGAAPYADCDPGSGAS